MGHQEHTKMKHEDGEAQHRSTSTRVQDEVLPEKKRRDSSHSKSKMITTSVLTQYSYRAVPWSLWSVDEAARLEREQKMVCKLLPKAVRATSESLPDENKPIFCV